MRLVQAFWNLFGIFTDNLSYNKFQCICSTLLSVSCVYTFIVATQIFCKMDKWCIIFSPSLAVMYDRALAFVTLLSRITIMVKSKRNFIKYKATVNAFEVHSPTSQTQLKNYETFSFSVVLLCLIVILPTNIYRLYYILYYDKTHYDYSLVIFYIFIYTQNLSMCCVETQFVCQCFVVYTKFREINDGIKELKGETVVRGKYPFTMTAGMLRANHKDKIVISLQERVCRYDNGFHGPWFSGYSMENTVELLRIKHWLTRNAAEKLNDLFGVHMGLSVFVLCVMALFDVYYEIFQDSPSKLLIYGWLLQYFLRISIIILVAHRTTKQVRRESVTFKYI